MKHNEKSIQRYKSETNVKQHAATQTHKVQRLHAAVHAHRICNRPGTVVADLIALLRTIQTKEIEKETETSAKQKLKKRQAAFSNTNAQGTASARCCSRASHLRSQLHRRRRVHWCSVKHSESEKENKTENSSKQT